MSLTSDKAAAKTALVSLLTDMLTKEDNSVDEYADRLIDIFEVWLKKANIKYVNGLTAGGNAVVGTFNGKLE